MNTLWRFVFTKKVVIFINEEKYNLIYRKLLLIERDTWLILKTTTTTTTTTIPFHDEVFRKRFLDARERTSFSDIDLLALRSFKTMINLY